MRRFWVYLMSVLMLTCTMVIAAAMVIGSRLQAEELLFSAGLEQNANLFKLYRMDMQRNITVGLTPDDQVDSGGVWSPDGTKIAFESRRITAILTDIYVMDAQGYNRNVISGTPQHDLYPVWSNDSRSIAYLRTGDQRTYTLYITDIATLQTRPMIRNNDTFISPAWSPDNQQIAYTAKSQTASYENISVLDVSTGETQLILRTTSSHVRPIWTPDGSGLVFVSTDYNYPQSDIAQVDVETRNAQPIIPDATFPVWSPDGRYLLYTTHSSHVLMAYDVRLGQTTTLYFDSNGTFEATAWSPDGLHIVYVSYIRSLKTSRIYRLNAADCLQHNPTCAPYPLTTVRGIYQLPKWKPRA